MNKKNVIISLFSQIVILIFGLIVPYVIIKNYGSDANGLLSTITQIFTYMALLEAGISQASKNMLYRYIKEKKQDDLNNILSISKSYYNKATIIYFIFVVILSFILPFAIKTELFYYEVFFLIFIEGLTGVISFFFIQNWTTILTVDGKQYVNSGFDLIYKIISYSLKIIFSLLNFNILLLPVGMLIGMIVKLFCYSIYMKKNYSWIKYKNIDKNEKLTDRNSYIVTEIAWTIFSSTDLIIISIFCSTQLSSVYSIYNMIFTALSLLLNSVYQSLVYLLGQSYYENKEKYTKLHDSFNMIFISGITILMSVSCILTIPFITLYVGDIADINYIYKFLPCLFGIVQMLSWSRYVSGNLTGICGYAKKVSYISLIEALINVVLSLILVNIFGIYGVVLATIIALPIKVIYCNYISDKKVLNRSCKNTIKILLLNYFIFICSTILGLFLNLNIDNFIEFVIYGFVLSILYFMISIILNYIVNRNIFKNAINLIVKR